MANSLILLDTSILIDYYRKTDKVNSIWLSLVRQEYDFAIAAVTKYEICAGAGAVQLKFWEDVMRLIIILPFDENTVDTAIRINSELKRKRKQIDIADLFIAATAMTHLLPIATLDRKHFTRVDGLQLIEI